MNCWLYSMDRMTHLRIAVVSLLAAVLVAAVSIALHLGGTQPHIRGGAAPRLDPVAAATALTPRPAQAGLAD